MYDIAHKEKSWQLGEVPSWGVEESKWHFCLQKGQEGGSGECQTLIPGQVTLETISEPAEDKVIWSCQRGFMKGK